MTSIDHPTTASTSSTLAAASQSDDLITDLGERILAELGADKSNQTLTRWLAHHIARLISAADQARVADTPDADTRAAEAATAILQLWQHRSAWPHGWPPPRTAAMVQILDLLPDLDNAGWHQETRFSHLHTLHYRVLATFCDLAITDADSLEQGWLDKFGELLTPDEVTLLRRAASVSERLDGLAQWWDGPRLHEPEPEPDADQSTNPRDDTAEDPLSHPLIALADAYRDTVVSFFLSDATPTPDAGTSLKQINQEGPIHGP